MVQLVPLDAISESAASSSDANGSTAQERRRKRTTAARKKVERAAHAHAPGLATMVAGHHHGMSRRTSANSNGKRYSKSEFQHLVADEHGDLHDPEYEAIRIVRRQPSVSGSSDSSVVSSSTEEESTANTTPFRNYRYQPPPTSNRRPINAPAPSFHTTSQSTRSSDNTSSASRRTYAGSGVTYLAPSITMPPNLSSSYASSMMSAEQYNPFTYVPTTSRPSEAFSHSMRPHSSSRRYDHNPTTSAAHPNGNLHSYVPAISPISEVAPPIPWSSTFTPSAEHSERHRTRQHDASVSGLESMKRNIQKVKLDVSFGLLKLKKK